MTEETLFEQVLQIPADERVAFLNRECPDPALRARVEALLAADAASSSPIDGPVEIARTVGDRATPDSDCPSLPTEREGAIVAGRYKLRQQIGEGGMGTVWMADQTEPVKRKVAVKLIRVERGQSKTILARFEAERQAIALMDHPHIAKLLDAGTTETGSPFFVMELVKGIPLNEFCDQHKLTIHERLNLFTQICSAVQHAHQKGVIHRDLKPGNILVESHDGKPVPKVIDFGLAKATTGLQLSEQSLFTAFGSVMGTPLYMAPEQATFNAVDVDTRADVYALGVILYELLTGTTPLTKETMKKAALDEMLRLVREQEAPTPSSRLSCAESAPSVAASRQMEPLKLGRFVKGELDWIVMKALAKERDRRYETANGFARDIERFLNHEPVTAGPPSASYRMRKFVQRNRAQVIAASLVLMALVAGIVGTTFGLLEARKQTEIARNEAELKEQARADEAKQRAIAEDNEGTAKAEKWKAEQAATKERLAKEEEARERRYSQAIADFVKEDFLALTSVEGQGRFGGDGLDRNATLLELLNRAAEKLKGRKGLDPRIEAELCWIVGVNYRGTGEAAKGVPFLERAVELRQQVLGVDHIDTLNAQNSLGMAYPAAGRLDQAVPLLEETLKQLKVKHGPEHPVTLTSMNNLATAYLSAGQLDKALPLYEETLRLTNAKLGPDHPFTLATVNNLAAGYQNAGQRDKGLPLLEETLRFMKAKLGPDHPATLTSMNNLAAGYQNAGQRDKALPLLEETLKLRKVKVGPDHPDTLTSMNNLAGAYRTAGQMDKAVPLYEETLKLMKAKLGPKHPLTLASKNNLAAAYQDAGQLDKALPLLEEKLMLVKAKLGPDHPDTLDTMGSLAVAYRKANRLDKALPMLEEAYRASKKFSFPSLRSVGPRLLDAYANAGKPSEAAKLIDEMLADARKNLPKESPQLAGMMAQFGMSLLEMKGFAEAEPLLRECLTIREKTQPDAWNTFNTQSMLGGALLGQRKYADAEPLLLKGYEGLKAREKTIPPQANTRLPEALDRLIELYTATNKPDEVKKYQVLRAKSPTPKEAAPMAKEKK